MLFRSGMKHVCYFRHALALDERRVKFLPEYAFGGSATDPQKPRDKTRGKWAVIQIVMCADPKLVQIPRERLHTQRRFGLQGRTQICQYILIYKSITNVRRLVAVEM